MFLVQHFILMLNLKSSMERFIDYTANNGDTAANKFKIQYGEIYRVSVCVCMPSIVRFKIQYGEIYSIIFLSHYHLFHNLKSSMERFIVFLQNLSIKFVKDLKSSMERFIVNTYKSDYENV